MATTEPYMVAGHLFDRMTQTCVQPKGNLQKYPSGVCCTRRTDMHLATKADIDDMQPKINFSCTPPLNWQELQQIDDDKVRWRAERDRAYDSLYNF